MSDQPETGNVGPDDSGEQPSLKYVVLLTDERGMNYVATGYVGVTLSEAKAARDKLERETGHKVLVLPCVDIPRHETDKGGI